MFLTIITFIIYYILPIIIVLGLLVFVHELGHFLVARKFGVKAEEFGFGFPPRMWGIYKNEQGKWKQVRGKRKVGDAADTIYSINWIPLGGFVKLGEDEEGGDDPNHFTNKPIWQRAAILLAGVSMNILLAAVLISFGFMVGLPQNMTALKPGAKILTEVKIQIMQIVPETPADVAKLKAGDIIISIDEHSFKTYNELQKFSDEHQGQELSYKIKRGKQTFEKSITPVLIEETGRGGIGIVIDETVIVRYPVPLAIIYGFETTILLVWFIIIAFSELIKNLILGRGLSVDLGGPVRIAEITGDMARLGLAYLINLTALLSINLAIINAFPFPALDGGRILFLFIEKIKGSPVKREVEAIIHNIGFALLMLLILVVTFRDVSRFWR